MNSYLEETCAIDRFISHVGIIRELIVLTETTDTTQVMYIYMFFSTI